MPPKTKKATAKEKSDSSNPVDAWVQTAKEALEKNRLEPVCHVMQELHKLLVQDPRLVKSFQESRVGELLSEGLDSIGTGQETGRDIVDASVAAGHVGAMLNNVEAMKWASREISGIAFNDSDNVKILCGTPAVRDALVAMGNALATDTPMDLSHFFAVFWAASAFAHITKGNNHNQTLFGTEEVRDTVVALGRVTVDNKNSAELQRSTSTHSETIHAVANVVTNIAKVSEKHIKLLGTENVRDTLVDMGRMAGGKKGKFLLPGSKNSKAVLQTAEAIRTLQSHSDNAKIFDTKEVKESLVKMSKAKAEEKRDSGAAKKRQR